MCVERRVEVGHDGGGDVEARGTRAAQSSSVAGTTPSYAANAASPWTVTPASCRAATTRGRNVVGDVGVHEQRLGGVADAGAVGLGVEHDRERHVEVGGARRRRRGSCRRRSRSPAPSTPRRRDWIRPAPPRGMSTSTRPRARISSLTRLVGVARHQLDDVGRQAGRHDGVAQHVDERGVAGRGRCELPRSSTALPDFRQMPGGVDGDVGPAPRRSSRPRRTAPAPGAARGRWRSVLPRTTSPTGSGSPATSRRPCGHRRHPVGGRAAAGRPCGPACRRPRRRRTSSALAASTSSVRRVQGVGHRVQRGVLGRPRGQRQLAARLPGATGQLRDVGAHAAKSSRAQESAERRRPPRGRSSCSCSIAVDHAT